VDVLRQTAEHRVFVHGVAIAEPGACMQHDPGMQHVVVAEAHAGLDDHMGPDTVARTQLGGRIDAGGRMDVIAQNRVSR